MVTWSPPQRSASRVRNGFERLESSVTVRPTVSSTQTFGSETNGASGRFELITSPECFLPTKEPFRVCLSWNGPDLWPHSLLPCILPQRPLKPRFLFIPDGHTAEHYGSLKPALAVRSELVSNLFRGSVVRQQAACRFSETGPKALTHIVLSMFVSPLSLLE